jgi:branched-chain amino acid aminotransferase
MHSHVLHNEIVKPAADTFLAAGQVGFLNGWGVFSTIRVRDGVLFAYQRHWNRMVRDAKLLHVPMPTSADWLHHQLLKLVSANHASNATLRLAIVRNKGGMFEGPGLDRSFELVAFTTGLRSWGDSVRLGIVEQGRHAQSPFAGTKVTSWCQNLTFYETAQQQGFDEVVLLNEHGQVSECTSANIFATFGNTVVTPPLSSGCLPGITRELLLDSVKANDITVSEKVLLPGDLEKADEVFITSTTRELLAVESIAGLKIQSIGFARARLQASFTSFADEYVASSPANVGTVSGVSR